MRAIRRLSTTIAIGLCSVLKYQAAVAFPSKAGVRIPLTATQQHTTTIPKMSSNSKQDESKLQFGPFSVARDHVFYTTSLSAAFVNLRPIVPGHVLVVPFRVVPLLSDLTTEEYADLWSTVRVVQQDILQKYFHDNSDDDDDDDGKKKLDDQCAFNIAVQDGKAAGQSVAHAHVHILPRIAGDYERNDDVYTDIDEWAPRDEMRQPNSSTLEVPEDSDRKDRTTEQMAEEAALYRKVLNSS